MALEDITPENGPLHYYPGSHGLPIYTPAMLGLKKGAGLSAEGNAAYAAFVQALVEAHHLPKHIATLRRGQALIWAANLLHGGEPILRPGATRHTQVTHYYFDDCFWYTPMNSDVELGRLFLRVPPDIRTGKLKQPTYLGRPVSISPYRRLRSLLSEWTRFIHST